MTKTTRHPLGRRLEHDPRSRAFPAVTMAVPLRTVTWHRYGAVLDQGNVGSCTGNAMAQVLNHKPLRQRGKVLTEEDALRLYSAATVLDDFPGVYPGEDTGSSGLAVAKAALQEGLISQYQHAFGLDHGLNVLMSGPVIVGTNWYDSMFDAGPGGLLHVDGSIAGGHEWSWIGVDMKNRHAICLNSWGREWGDRGKFRLTFDDLNRLLREDGDITVPVR